MRGFRVQGSGFRGEDVKVDVKCLPLTSWPCANTTITAMPEEEEKEKEKEAAAVRTQAP